MAKGFKLPYRISEFDEDSPLAVQRNFNEIEYYLNVLLRGVSGIEEQLSLFATAPVTTDYVFPDEEVLDTHPTLNAMEYPLELEGRPGSLDCAIKTDAYGGIDEVWVARVIDHKLYVEVYGEAGFTSPGNSFPVHNYAPGSQVVDAAIAFDGDLSQYDIFISEEIPHIFWVERSGGEDIIYTICWDGSGDQPEPTVLGVAALNMYGEAAPSTANIQT